MKRWERPLLLFSLALNVAFVSLAAMLHRPQADPAPEARIEATPDLPPPPEWRAHRRAKIGRALGLSREQREKLDADFDQLRPQLRAAHLDIEEQRFAYKAALVRGDAGAARGATRALSRAQAKVDSLVAEAMLQETSQLRPDQRTSYVRMTFRHGFGSSPRFPGERGRRSGHRRQAEPRSESLGAGHL